MSDVAEYCRTLQGGRQASDDARRTTHPLGTYPSRHPPPGYPAETQWGWVPRGLGTKAVRCLVVRFCPRTTRRAFPTGPKGWKEIAPGGGLEKGLP